MVKTALILFTIILSCWTAVAQGKISEREHIGWGKENVLLSKPYYVQATLSVDGLTQILKIDFNAHRKQNTWAVALIKLDNPPETGWNAVKVVYKAELPAGIRMYVGFEEEEVTYEHFWESEPGDFVTVIIPKSKLAVGKWCRKTDKNQELDADQIKTILIGAHGDWNGDGKDAGSCEIKDIVLVKDRSLP